MLTNNDYFEFYELMLKTMAVEKFDNDYDLFTHLNKSKFIQTKLEDGVYSEILFTLSKEVIENLLNDNMLKGTITPTKDGNIYTFNGLTTTGYQYLSNLEQPKFKEKLKNALKSEGIPVTPTNISKVIAKLLW